mmetsp:Transcript_14619/g.47970  ORF Transcript_14619/g.47970 Transcript_14619/m.47970 type:complete len:944 (+) Transcript_14619:37-2868(+)
MGCCVSSPAGDAEFSSLEVPRSDSALMREKNAVVEGGRRARAGTLKQPAGAILGETDDVKTKSQVAVIRASQHQLPGLKRRSTLTLTGGSARWEKLRVMVANDMDFTSMSTREYTKDGKAREMLTKVLEGAGVLTFIDAIGANKVLDSIYLIKLERGQEVFEDMVTRDVNMYIVQSGEMALKKSAGTGTTRIIKRASYGESLGEDAMMNNCVASATCVALSSSKVWVLPKSKYNAEKFQAVIRMASLRSHIIASIPILASLKYEQRALLADALESVTLPAGQYVYKEGDEANKFYVIAEGEVSQLKDGAEVAHLAKGSYFGEQALFNATKRPFSILTDTVVTLFTLSRELFAQTIGPIESVWKASQLRNLPMLSFLPDETMEKIVEQLELLEVDVGEVLFDHGNEEGAFYLVHSGEVTVTSGGEKTVLARGLSFGALTTFSVAEEGATARVTAAGPNSDCAELYILMPEQVRQVLQMDAEDMQLAWLVASLRSVPQFKLVEDQEQLEKLGRGLQTMYFEHGDIIVKQGDAGECLYIIEHGTVVIETDGVELSVLTVGSVFGERAALFKEERAANARAQGRVVTRALSRGTIEKVLGPLKTFTESLKPRTFVVQHIEPSEVSIVKVLGTGGFGTVELARWSGSANKDEFFAWKKMSKAHFLEENIVDLVARERDCMGECTDCPFVVKLVATSRDKYFIYMLLEPLMGGDLYTRMKRDLPGGVFSEGDCKFYISNLVLALEFLHSRNICHRDLKLENLLVSHHTGYISLCDFGFAKQLGPGEKTFSFVGTPDYMAPEMVKEIGHSVGVDWWALGILVYEMLTGDPPFAETKLTDLRMEELQALTEVELELPRECSQQALDFIERLLQVVPSKRLGVFMGGTANVIKHPWFASLEWPLLRNRAFKAPWIPGLLDGEDTSSFSAAAIDQAPWGELTYRESKGAFDDW